MINYFIKIMPEYIQKFVNKPHYSTPLGRWNHNISNFNSSMSNHDHCGDELCNIHTLMNREKKLIKKYKN